MQFLLNQQAQFSIDLERLAGKTDRIADGVIGLTGIVGQLASKQEITGRQLEETGRRVDEMGKRLEDSDARLTEHIRTVQSHLDIVISMFERHLREDHGREPS